MQFMKDRKGADSPKEEVAVADAHHGINASGHQQELERNFGLWAIVGMALTAGNTWIAFGDAYLTLFNRFRLLRSIMEARQGSYTSSLSSQYCIGSSQRRSLSSHLPCHLPEEVQHSLPLGDSDSRATWALGRLLCRLVEFPCLDFWPGLNGADSLYSAHEHVCGVTSRFRYRALARLRNISGLFFLLAGVVISIIVCAVMPGVTGNGYATSASVWKEWVNSTGYTSDGFVFLAGMLNGAFAVGTPDITSHMAEEIPRPSSNIPKAVLAQYITGFVTALCYSIAILYAITDLDAVLNQHRRVAGGNVPPTLRWHPRRAFNGKPHVLDPRKRSCDAISNVLREGCIYLGSDTAFMAFVGSFAVLGFLSYISAILPHLLSRRQSVRPGKFSMGSAGFVVNTVAVLFILAFTVIFCFPFALPVDAASMNYTCLIVGGFTILVAALWAFIQKGYVGPQYVPLEAEMMTKNARHHLENPAFDTMPLHNLRAFQLRSVSRSCGK
ncbi:hypothetical protein KC364_g92 [Hortaea werneckii]|nr:hypothetical protein KC364_g92 [Hortaea werneckii]